MLIQYEQKVLLADELSQSQCLLLDRNNMNQVWMFTECRRDKFQWC